ncbi:rac GTPase-activating protein 1 [Tribolium castaneum]|uniref:Rac GTPase-activating protein 1-like Protein n=1 Tax=Tribolium castaneum TaxID=7070 RepID=D6WE23_TRICA|nr:PREDICTED: rac GTPase-activating protein 1 [Tribolium castaneum]EFA01222.2 Rac GTPase-activating protein 1-like Protein [Tribolium castaneum]|eukprot:XP_008199257.1 PREDICTED: rac GTPase-activating protein 1 [Tribolium castaneum]
MCDTPFKTPLPYRTPRADLNRDMFVEKGASDSDESVASCNSDNMGSGSGQSSNGDISLAAQFDDLMRSYRPFRNNELETLPAFMEFVEEVKLLYVDYFQALDEINRLKNVLDNKVVECSDLENKLHTARKMIDKEKLMVRTARKERDELASQINLVKDLLFKDKNTTIRFSDEMRQKFSFLHNNNWQSEWDLTSANGNGHHPQLSAIREVNSTGSMLSDFSYSQSEDDLDHSRLSGVAWKKHRPSTGASAEPAIKKRRSSGNKVVEIGAADTVRATTTLTLNKDGPITATSIIESVPKTPGAPESAHTADSYPSAPPANLVFESWARESPRKTHQKLAGKEHCFQQKTLVMPETCTSCDKRIRFGRSAFKCKECKALCHLECKNNLPLPCIPVVHTPNQRNGLGVIGDYTPTTPPMVPAILIHCINEIELRGLSEVGLYRVPGSERDVKALKERFLKGKGAPCLNQVDIPVICGTVKDFLRGLHEPVITYALWKKFVQAVNAQDPLDIQPALYQAISELPQPNRDTLAYMILHLQKVAEAKECKMNIGNLAKIFGPTLVGYSSDNPNPNNLLDEIVQHNMVMEHLLNIPSDYWSGFINIEPTYQRGKLQQTPSTDSLLRPIAPKGLFTPVSANRSCAKKKQKYFPSPKNFR